MEEYARVALTQMQEKEYYQEILLDKVENIREYAIVFHDKKCLVR